MNEITIFLTENDAIQYRLFQQHYKTFMLLMNKGVFDIRKGNAILSFDHEGILQTIRREDFMYSREFEGR